MRENKQKVTEVVILVKTLQNNGGNFPSVSSPAAATVVLFLEQFSEENFGR